MEKNETISTEIRDRTWLCIIQGRIQEFEKGGAKLKKKFAPPAKLLRTPPYRAVANRISNSEKKGLFVKKKKRKIVPNIVPAHCW